MKSSPILLILDLDETLIHATKNPLSHAADFKIWDFHVYRRPHLIEFLLQINEWYELAIWSSASEDYVKAMVEQIKPPAIDFKFIWGRNRCTMGLRPQFEDDFTQHRHTYSSYTHYKKLEKVKRLGYKINKILIVDDTPLKVYHNYGNAIYPKPFEGDLKDNELPLLLKYLETLKAVSNVRSIEKRHWRTQII